MPWGAGSSFLGYVQQAYLGTVSPIPTYPTNNFWDNVQGSGYTIKSPFVGNPIVRKNQDHLAELIDKSNNIDVNREELNKQILNKIVTTQSKLNHLPNRLQTYMARKKG